MQLWLSHGSLKNYMKNLLIALSLCLAACVGNTDTSSPEDESVVDDSATDDNWGDWRDRDDYGYGCDQVSVHKIEVDGKDYWIEIPIACDPSPYVFRGDPEPNDPLEERGLDTQEDVNTIHNSQPTY